MVDNFPTYYLSKWYHEEYMKPDSRKVVTEVKKTLYKKLIDSDLKEERKELDNLINKLDKLEDQEKTIMFPKKDLQDKTLFEKVDSLGYIGYYHEDTLPLDMISEIDHGTKIIFF